MSHQERSDALRADMRELARRVQNLDWLTTKTENTLDQMRNEVEGIRLAVDDSGSTVPCILSDDFHLDAFLYLSFIRENQCKQSQWR